MTERVRQRPLDPRLLRWASATGRFMIASIVAASLTAALVIAQAWFLADALAAVFLGGADLDAISTDVIVLCVVIVARAALSYALDHLAHGSAAAAKSQLRTAVLEHSVELGPEFMAGPRAAELPQLTTRGIDGLDAYFSKYLPQLVLAVIVPVAVGTAILTQDLIATIVIVLTLPLIPVFMVLVGLHTQHEVDKQWDSLARLAGYFLDIVSGLPTLKALGRDRAQASTLREVGDVYRRRTMRVLRVSFLSSLVLELLATLSVAIVAVSIGLRLVEGTMDLRAGLIVLILAPEAYLPLRMVGANYHASADGVAASSRILDILDEPPPRQPTGTSRVDLSGCGFDVRDVTASYPDRPVPALDSFSCRVPPGSITAITGPSGAGKTTLLGLLLGLRSSESGSVRVTGPAVGQDVCELSRTEYLRRIAWLPQRPLLLPGTVADNVRLGNAGASVTDVRTALTAVGLEGSRDGTPWDRVLVGEDGAGLSAGQKRRVALARVFARPSDVAVLDEPAAALDPDTEAVVIRAVTALRDSGRTVVLVAHHPDVVAAADHVIELPPPEVRDSGPTPERARRAGTLPGLAT